MKKIITLVLFVFLYYNGFSQWLNLDSIPVVRCAFSAFSIGDTGYAVAGGGSGGYLSDAEIYIKSTNTWQGIQAYPQGGNGNSVTGFAIGDTGYTGLGAAAGYYFSDFFYKYDPHTNNWTQIANLPGQGRASAVSFVINGKGYVGGGVNSGVPNTYLLDHPLNDFYVYDPSTGQWDSIARCPAKGVAFQSTAFVINGKAYVGTGGMQVGGSSSQTYVPQSDFWCYDPGTNTWDSVAPFGGGVRMGCFSFGACNKGYVGCGVNDANQSQFQNDVWEFDPSNGPYGTWTKLGNYGGTPRSCADAFVIGTHGYVLGGFYNTSNATGGALWEYLPIDTPSFSANTTTCAGGTIAFTDTSSYGPSNWYWQFPGGKPDTSTSQSPTVEYDTSGTFDVILTAWNACDSGTKTFSSYITVSSAFSISVTPDSPSVCNGQHVTLKANGGMKYQWIGTPDTTDSVSVNPSVDTAYELMVTNGTCSRDTLISVSVRQAPALIIQPPSPVSVCLGQNVALSVPTSGTDYTWSPSSTLSSSTADTVLATPLVQTTYVVSGIDSLGCAVTSDSEVVTINTGPSKPTIMQHDSVLISSSTQSNQWLRNDTIINGATNQDFIVTTSGYYQVTVSNPANGCSTTSDSLFASGINELAVESGQLSVYPNPTGGEIIVNISSSVAEVKNWNLQITDVLGRMVYSKLSLNYSNVVDLSNLSNGVYFIFVINKTGRAVVPVVKE